MSGTNYPNGIATRKKYSGNTTGDSRVAASTKLLLKTAVIHCDAQTSETQTEFTPPATAIIKDVYVNVKTVDPTETVDIGTAGTSNDPDGFLDGVSLATLGLVKGSLADGAITLGALLREETGTGADVAYAKTDCISAGGDPLTYTCSPGSDTAVFDIIVVYYEVVDEVN